MLACRFVRADTCNVTAISQRWLWTKNGQLFNLDMLECINVEQARNNNKFHFLNLEKCVSKSRDQLWKCGQNNSYYVWQEKSKEYLYIGDERRNYVLSHSTKAGKWKRYGSKKSLCSEGK